MSIPYLQPGDHLIYCIELPTLDLWGWLTDLAIQMKTFTRRAAHIEVYDGLDSALASRAGGVDRYDFRRDDLQFVLRPKQWNHAAATEWFERVARHQRYDWVGLFCFTLAVRQGAPDRMFCSEFARNLDRAAGCPSFAEDWPGDLTSPGAFLESPAFNPIWLA